jgi:hypothetical protein
MTVSLERTFFIQADFCKNIMHVRRQPRLPGCIANLHNTLKKSPSIHSSHVQANFTGKMLVLKPYISVSGKANI